MNNYYDQKYFDWQKKAGEFGGWANISKFSKYIKPTDSVLDFGCGGGYLLSNINCNKKVGIEINDTATEIARRNGVEIYKDTDDAPGLFDVVISDNAMEHVDYPLGELKKLKDKLKLGGKIICIVPCESISMRYKKGNVNYHLYSWSPMAIGNLLTEAGFQVVESKAYIHKWPPLSRVWAKWFGRNFFDFTCRLYGEFERSWFQVRVVGINPKNESNNSVAN